MKLKCTIGSINFATTGAKSVNRGDEFEVSDAVAKGLIARGYAVEVPTKAARPAKPAK
jgi:hypothetical protein